MSKSEICTTEDEGKRDEVGLFGKGNTLGKGRPKGSKNRSTLVREALEGKFMDMTEKEFEDIMKVLLRRAKDENRGDKMRQLIMDRIVSVVPAEKDKASSKPVVNINISSMDEPKIVGESGESSE